MELWKPNYIDTSSAIVVNSNTATAEYIMRPDITYQYVSSGFNDDNTTVTMRINFSETTTVSRIALAGMNLREFSVYYNGVTANAFVLTSTGATTASLFNANSETAMVLEATPVACTSVSLDMKKTIVANAEKAIGYLVLSQERLTFSRIPAAKGYRPLLQAEEVVHELSDGLTRIQKIADFWEADVRLEYITRTFRDSLRTIYNLHASHIFVPFGTTTAWDQVIFPCVWPAPFDFYTFADNAPSAGFEGTIRLKQTTP